MSLAGWRANITRKSNIRPCARINLTTGGGYFYYSNINTDVFERTTGNWLKLSAGLISELSYDQVISVWQRSSEINETDIEIADLNLLDLIKADPILTNAEVELSFVVPGEIDWEDRYIILRGTLRYPEWGGGDETIKFRCCPRNFRTDLRFPPLVIDDVKWPNAPDKNLGEESYPIIYGIPIESYCPYADTSTYKYIISGHNMDTVPNKFELVNFDKVTRQEVFSSECDATTDFDCTTGGAGAWAAAAGNIYFAHNANAYGYAWLIDANNAHIKAYNQFIRMSCKFEVVGAVLTQIGYLVRYIDANNYIEATLQVDALGNWLGRILWHIGGGVVQAITAPLATPQTPWVEFALRADGNVISLYFNGEQFLEGEQNQFPISGDTCVYVFHETHLMASAYIDWVMFPVHEPVCSNTIDGEGNAVCVADFEDNLGLDTEVYCSRGYGKEDVSGNPITDFGEAFKDMVENYSDLDTDDKDALGLAAAASDLSGYTCSIIFNGASDVFESISERLTKQLPLIPLWKEGKFSAIVLDYSRVDISAYLKIPGNIIRREGRVTNSPIEDIGNVFTVKYQYSPIQNRFLNKVVRDNTNNAACALSHNKFGRRVFPEIEAYDIQTLATATLLADFVASHYSWPQLLAGYSVVKEYHWLLPNALVLISDSELGFVDKKFIIERATPLEDRLLISVRSIE